MKTRIEFAGVPVPTREDEPVGLSSAAVLHALRSAVEGTQERAVDDGDFATMATLLEQFKGATVSTVLSRQVEPGRWAPGATVRVLSPEGAALTLSPSESALLWRLWTAYERTGMTLAEAPVVLAVRTLRDATRNWDAVAVSADATVGRAGKPARVGK